MILGLVPARKGSKAVSKPLRTVTGFSLVEWAIVAAKMAGCLTHIALSSEDDETLAIAVAQGVQPLRRPLDLCGDWVPDLPVAQHALEALDAPDTAILVWLRPTAPFRHPVEIRAVVAMLQAQPEFSSVRSVIPSPSHPQKCYQSAGFQGLAFDALVPYTPHHWANGPRQALPPVYQPVGFIDAVWARWVRAGSMEGPLIARWDAPRERALDLDTDEDFRVADRLATSRGWRPGEVG